MKDYYQLVKDVLGSTGVIVPMGDRVYENAAATTVTTTGPGGSFVFTYSEARTAFDLPTLYRGRGRIPEVPFNGVDERLTSPDADYFSLGNGANDIAYSMCLWANLTDDVTQRTLLNKFAGATAREWTLDKRADKTIIMLLRDESVPVSVTRSQNAASILGQLHHIGVTYSGLGGATAMNGVTLYIDGVAVASTASNDATYVSSENLTAQVEIGSNNGVNWHKGTILGGALGPAMAQAELTAAQISLLYDIGRDAQRRQSRLLLPVGMR